MFYHPYLKKKETGNQKCFAQDQRYLCTRSEMILIKKLCAEAIGALAVQPEPFYEGSADKGTDLNTKKQHSKPEKYKQDGFSPK